MEVISGIEWSEEDGVIALLIDEGEQDSGGEAEDNEGSGKDDGVDGG